MPESETVVWCIYDTKQRLLLVAEHEWNWIALIDFAKPNAIEIEVSNPEEMRTKPSP